MTRHAIAGTVAICCIIAGACAADSTTAPTTEPEKDFKPITIDGEDVAAVSALPLPKGTRVRLRLLARGNGGAIRLGEARTLEAGVSAMTVWDTPITNAQLSEMVRSGGFVAVAAGPKETPLKLEKVEADAATEGATKLSFEGGLVVQVVLVPPRGMTTRPVP